MQLCLIYVATFFFLDIEKTITEDEEREQLAKDVAKDWNAGNSSSLSFHLGCLYM